MYVKICGTTSEQDALLAVALGADAIGFIFAPSKRQVAVQRVADIVKRLPPDVATIGVFKDELPERVIDMVGQAGLSGAQLNGSVSSSALAKVKERVPLVIRAIAADDPALAHAASLDVDLILLDSPTPGSGQTFDWDIIGDLTAHQKVLLAGGLHPDNVQQAIARVGPFGVDVATGVEKSPGVKDPVRLRQFIQRAKAPIEPRRPRTATGT